jgi:hypothetical protein
VVKWLAKKSDVSVSDKQGASVVRLGKNGAKIAEHAIWKDESQKPRVLLHLKIYSSQPVDADSQPSKS